jgi:mannose-1-phosphate guanylyltransferase
VNRFWEKPDAKLATALFKRGCLWNSFVMVGRVRALLETTRSALPTLYAQFTEIAPVFQTPAERHASRGIYSQIEETNFSHDVLARRPQDLSVLRVADVGWSDLGEPTRVLSTLAHIGIESQLALSAS